MAAVATTHRTDQGRGGKAASALLLLMVATLPSCLTRALWDRSVEGVRLAPRLVDEATEEHDGELAFGGDGRVVEAWLRGADGVVRWSVRAPDGGDAASVVLAGRGAGPVEAIELQGVRSYVDSDLTRSAATVIVRARLEPQRLGSVVAARDLTPQAREVLATTRRNAFAFAADPLLRFPGVYRDCLKRLAAIDLGRLAGGQPGAAVQVQSFVLVDDEGQPVFEPGSTRRREPVVPDREPTVDERLELLAQVTVLARVRVEGREVLLQLDPEQVWLASGAELTGDVLAYRSTWSLFPAHPDHPGPPGRRRLAARATIHTRRYELIRSAVDDPDFWSKLAWTPLTLALDIATAPLQAWLFSEDDEEYDPRPARRRR